MSPLTVRRYRAERLLRDEFEGLRAKVLARVAQRLRTCGAALDAGDLDACYSQAWQGLYAAVLEGQQIDDVAAWLTLVSYRRAIDEHRARRRVTCKPLDHACGAGVETHAAATLRERTGVDHDIAARLDDHARLRQLFEALRGRLNAREQQAATLCYLQGLSRAQAAARMGVSESRMRKLMDGAGSRSPGVAAKVGALVQTIGADGWCEEQRSLMRGLAYGMLDPDGERHRLAVLHRDACPACRAYVVSLRGLAAVLPPVPVLSLATGVLAGSGAGAALAGGASGNPAASGAAGGGSLGGIGGATLSASGAAGVGAAGGGWWLAGPLGAKLAVGCLVALGVGAGCVALNGPSGVAAGHAHRTHARHAALARAAAASAGAPVAPAVAPVPSADLPERGAAATAARPRVSALARASREFGPEQPAHVAGSTSTSSPAARAASATPSGRTAQSPAHAGDGGAGLARSSSSGKEPAAQREFAPG